MVISSRVVKMIAVGALLIGALVYALGRWDASVSHSLEELDREVASVQHLAHAYHVKLDAQRAATARAAKEVVVLRALVHAQERAIASMRDTLATLDSVLPTLTDSASRESNLLAQLDVARRAIWRATAALATQQAITDSAWADRDHWRALAEAATTPLDSAAAAAGHAAQKARCWLIPHVVGCPSRGAIALVSGLLGVTLGVLATR